MLDKRTINRVVIILMLGIFGLSISTTAYAWGDRDRSPASHHSDRYDRDHHSSYPYGKIEFGLPHGSITIVLGSGQYYYGKGRFYKKSHKGYVIVPAPRHEIVYRIPTGCRRIVRGNDVYYTYDGIYYKKLPRGFEIVDTPDFVVVESNRTIVNPSIERMNDVVTVNVPNSRGGYTEVILRKSGNGYVGPQGEFYSEFPSIEQLRIMYANKS